MQERINMKWIKFKEALPKPNSLILLESHDKAFLALVFVRPDGRNGSFSLCRENHWCNNESCGCNHQCCGCPIDLNFEDRWFCLDEIIDHNQLEQSKRENRE